MRGHSDPSSGVDPLNAGDDFFEGLVEAAGTAVVTVDADGTVVYANAAVEDLLGYAPADLQGERLTAFIPDWVEDRYEQRLQHLADGDRNAPPAEETFEAAWPTDDGEVRLSVSAFAHESDGRTLFTAILREAPDREEPVEDRGEESADRPNERNTGEAKTDERSENEEPCEGALVEDLFDASPIAFAVRDADGSLLRANDRAAELAGVGTDRLPLDAEDDESDTWTVYGTDGEPMAREDHPAYRALETGEPVYDETVVVEKPTGERVYLSVSAVPVVEDGAVQQVVTAAEDVTELERTQRELELRREELETELAEVFTRVADAFFALNDDWEFTYVNEEAEELLGCDEHELVGESVWNAFPAAVDTTFEREYRRAFETQEPVSLTEFYPPLSTWFDIRAYPSETGLSVYFQDVTEREQRERELERYETIVETTDDGIYILNEEMEFSMVNTALTEMTGYDREELLGRPVWDVVDNADEIRAAIDRRVDALVSGERTSATVDVDVLPRDGETFPAQAVFVVQETTDGHEYIGVVRDVTGQKRREAELRDRVEQQRALSEFSRHALEDRQLDDLMDEAVELVGEAFDHEYSKILRFRPEEDDLLLEAGHGWDDEVLGSATFDTERGSQAGFTLMSREPVVVEDFPNEERFAYPDLKAEKGITSGISTIVGTLDDPWGILETHTTDRREFDDYDVQFVQSIAHILYTAIRRGERERQLELYETITETVEDGVYALDPDERFVMVNGAFCEMTGYDREELLGAHASLVHSDTVNERAAQLAEEAIEDFGSAMIEFDLQTRDGETVPVESRFGPYVHESGEFSRTGVVRDVSERKRFERTLTALHESSRELLGLETADAVAESVLQTVTDVLGIPGASIYLWNEDDEELAPAAASDRIEEIFGGDLPAFGPGGESITWRSFADGRTISLDDVAETDLAYRADTPLRSGVWIPLGDHGVLAVISEETDAFGPEAEELADLLAATAEATFDRVERERERRERERELETQNERLDAFASMLAHELRNPLEIAQIYLDMGTGNVDFDREAGRAFREVEQALDRIEEMIETLLVVTRRGGTVDTTEVVDLGTKAAEWWDAVDPDGTLVVDTDRRIRADASRLRQLLENLFRNAEEHGGPGVTVRVGDLPDGFYVEDDGPGIPEDERGRVFDPGYSTSNVGIGFGLAVVRQLVDAHDWHCEIAESEGGGARFEFTDVEIAEE